MHRVLVLQIETAIVLMTCLLAAFQSAVGEEQSVHAQVGSYWNYELTDEIKQTKSILETTLTEVNGDERVIRHNLRGQSPGTAFVYDRNWNIVEGGPWRHQPNNGVGIPEPFQIGSRSKGDITYTQQLATGWSDPRPAVIKAEIVSTETISTKAGEFETYRIEYTMTTHGLSNQPLSVSETKIVLWFSPKIDHWVRGVDETRTDGHLVWRNSAELIEYQVR